MVLSKRYEVKIARGAPVTVSKRRPLGDVSSPGSTSQGIIKLDVIRQRWNLSTPQTSVPCPVLYSIAQHRDGKVPLPRPTILFVLISACGKAERD